MLVVMSDLHFAESKTNQLGQIEFNNNLPAIVYRNYFQELAVIIKQKEIKKVDLVLAGDIFELTRTGLWLKDDLRPYFGLKEIFPDSQIEKRVIEILSEIAADDRVSETLQDIRSIDRIVGVPVHIHYIPGNHDRLVNCTRSTRRIVKRMLGISETDEPFNNSFIFAPQSQPLVLVRHGHEYDPINFGEDITKQNVIPFEIDQIVYDKPIFGDFFTVEIATRLPVFFKRYYSDDVIINDNNLFRIYKRLIEFDNLRPSSALLNYLFSTPGLSKRKSWDMLEPVFINILNAISSTDTIYHNHKERYSLNFGQSLLLAIIINANIFRKKFPYWLIIMIMKVVSKNIKQPSVRNIVAKETCLDEDSDIKCIISGHTHNPEVEIVSFNNGVERYYINSGSWRNQVLAASKLNSFGHLRALAKVIVFGTDEQNPEYDKKPEWSFDYNSELGYGKQD
ncbi:MAG: metallophosphoesterase [Anaerolineaceae bacterium]|nr:metallophosphoesterase [Anaerolineaceae bacterium]